MNCERTNDTHRQYPRSLQEAFGPYTDSNLEPMPDRPSSVPEPLSRKLQDYAVFLCLLLTIFTLYCVSLT